MRFFEQWKGFIWEYHSFGEYMQCLLGRLIGTIIGFGILFLIGCFLNLSGQAD